MAGVEITVKLFFVDHDHLKHACPGYNKGHELQYHTNVIPEKANTRISAAFAYSALL